MVKTIKTREEAKKFLIKQLEEEKELIDPEIWDILVDLNRRGFITYQSCAGHRSIAEPNRLNYGYIGFLRLDAYEKEGLIWVLQSYGLKGIKVEDITEDNYWFQGEATMATFNSIGKPIPLENDVTELLKTIERGAGDTEISIYNALGLPWQRPEERG